ncbi:ATP-dependent DNA helicase RecG, partial [Patescibacteria group bacterium]|nr:ATP-dependent DNA helicase RecG [Patescibacteria group bacterium]
MLTLKTSIAELTRVGKTVAQQMGKLEIKTVGDLLTHYPFRYDDYSKILSIKDLKTKKTGTIKAKINLIANHRSPRKKMVITEAIVSDQTDSLKVIWFNQGFLTRTFKSGQQIYLAGKINYDNYYGLQLTNPSYELCKDKSPIHTGRLVPIYPSTAKLSQKQVRFLVRQILPLIQEVPDWLPREIKTKYNLTSLSFALEQIHFPQNQPWLERAIHRLKFNELFLIQAQNQLIRQRIKNREAFPIKFKLKETKKFVQSLAFKLTDAQRKTSWEIINDIGKNSPMNRLLEGDVGSGKTIVAVIAILNALINKYQAAYMAPTEILAEQHFKNITELFTPLRDKSLTEFKNFKIALLTRNNAKINSGRKIKKTELLKEISSGKIDLIIGTHTLIQEKIKLKKLSLAIVDEQHRFGVAQRAQLIRQSSINNHQSTIYSPHFLSMTATPIPRSVALTLYGDLDLSIIDQIPPGRKEIITKIVKPDEIKQTYQFVEKEISEGRQAFVVCPLIDPSDKLGV